MNQGLGAVSAMLGGALGLPSRPYREPALPLRSRIDTPHYIPGYIDRTGRSGAYGFECDSCGHEEPKKIKTALELAKAAREHNCKH